MQKTTSEIHEAWVKAYNSVPKPKDPHAVFAELLGVSRQEAKALCIKHVFKDNTDSAVCSWIREMDGTVQRLSDIILKSDLGYTKKDLLER